MTEKETQPITLINPKEQPKSPSLLGNMFIMLILFGMVWGGQTLTKRWGKKVVAPEETSSTHIVMEDLENEQPIAESATVTMPTEDRRQKTEDRGPKTEDQKPKKKVAKKTNKPRRTQNAKQRVAIKKFRSTIHDSRSTKSVYAQPDPYTDGGPQDLDRLENRGKYGLPAKSKTTQKIKTVTATPPLPLDERDQFIPFEKD